MSDFSEAQKAYMNALFTKVSDELKKKTEELSTNLKAEVNEIREDICQIAEKYEDKIKLLEAENQQLKENITYLQRKVRKNNLVIYGLNKSNTNIFETVIKFLRDTLEINLRQEDFNDIYKIGNNVNSPIVAEFISYQTKTSILQNSYKLKGKNIYISQDLSSSDRADNKKLVRYMKEARSKGIQSYLKGRKLVIGEDTYTLSELENKTHKDYEELKQQNIEEDFQEDNRSECLSAPATPDPIGRQKRLLSELELENNGEPVQQEIKKPKQTITKATKPDTKTSKPSAIKTRSNTTALQQF